MAYVAFSEMGGAASVRARPIDRQLSPAAEERLSALEWLVVAIARRDGRGSLRRPGRMASALRVLFKKPNPRLADGRLEALRRMAVLSWQNGYTVPSAEVRSFLAAGFTPGQYELMVDTIAASQAADRRRTARR